MLPMNTANARHIVMKIAELIELTSIFQTRYGRGYHLKPGGPQDAWALHQAIFDQQRDIALLLDLDVLENPSQVISTWWKWQETLDSGVAALLAQEACHLIACCASFEANPMGTCSLAVIAAQRAIASGLHPSSRMIAMQELAPARAS